MKPEEIKSLILEQFPESIISEVENATPVCFEISPEQIFAVCEFIHAHEATYFDHLACLTGIDNGPEANTMEVVYTLYSIPYDLHLGLKVVLDREKPLVDSVTPVWNAANWHEREAYDLLGIRFKNHPDLRRILMPEDWEGHPLRKDYEEPETYHEVKVKY